MESLPAARVQTENVPGPQGAGVRCLVTGAAGFIGSHLAERLVGEGYEVIGVDSFSDYYSADLKAANLSGLGSERRFRFVRGDLLTCRLEELLVGVEYIFHQAGQPGVRGGWGKSFDQYLNNNVLATQRLLEAAKGLSLEKFVYASSSSVYGETESFPTSEEVVPHPVSPYGVSKLAGEQLCYLYWRNYAIPTISLRYFTVYGPRQRPDMAFHKFIRAISEGSPMAVYGDGSQTRDVTYIDDVVSANLLAAKSDVVGQVMNIGGESQITLLDSIGMIQEIVGEPATLDFEQTMHGEPKDTAADISHARKHLGYEPSVGLEEGLSKQVEWFRLDVGG